ncbi:MAG: hypothetical protein ACI8P3_003973 [Saprospiraceae bacterium]|jgi:hypothetical protein
MKITVKNITESAIKASDSLVEGSLATGAKWQKISAKLMKEGTVLFGKQQDLTLSTLEELKGLVVSGNKRFRNLLGVELPKVKKTTKTTKVETAKPVAVKKTVTPAKVVKKTPAKILAEK